MSTIADTNESAILFTLIQVMLITTMTLFAMAQKFRNRSPWFTLQTLGCILTWN